MLALFIYLAATVSASPFLQSSDKLLSAPPCPPLLALFSARHHLVSMHQKVLLTSLPGCPPCPASKTLPVCHGNSQPSCHAQQSEQRKGQKDKRWLQRQLEKPQGRDAAPELNSHCPSCNWAEHGVIHKAFHVELSQLACKVNAFCLRLQSRHCAWTSFLCLMSGANLLVWTQWGLAPLHVGAAHFQVCPVSSLPHCPAYHCSQSPWSPSTPVHAETSPFRWALGSSGGALPSGLCQAILLYPMCLVALCCNASASPLWLSN